MKLSNNSAVINIIATICAVSAAFQSVTHCEGHAHLMTPSSRNYYAHQDTRDGGGGSYSPLNQTGVAPKEECPHCLDQNQGMCGVTQNNERDYDQWLDMNGDPMPWKSQKTYEVGDTIKIEIWMATNHQGHFELKGCPVEDGKSSSATAECFEKYKLEFVEDVTNKMPQDDAYPERAYFYGGQGWGNTKFKYKFKLPEELSGNRVLLQFFWYTGNSCQYPGYSDYISKNSDKLKWSPGKLTDCPGSMYPWNGDPFLARSSGTPEYFVNCAEVTIGGTAPDTPDVPSPSDADDADGCCSHDYKTCAAWGADGKDYCKQNEDTVWLENGEDSSSQCLARYAACTDNESSCCDGLTCAGDKYYKQCNTGGDSIARSMLRSF